MNTKTSSLVAFISLVYFFIYRGLGTLWPSFFANPNVARGALFLAFLASLGWLLFFASFLSVADRENLNSFRVATGWAIFGSACICFLYFRENLRIFGIDFLREVIFSERMEKLVVFFPLLGTALMLIFIIFLVRYKAIVLSPQSQQAVTWAVGGAAASFLLRLVVVVNFLLTQESKWMGDLQGILLYFGLFLLIISFIGWGGFLWVLSTEKNDVIA
ncbi:MAG: hypothetical protein DRI99_03180 [Candidatus Aminicenantes bacterium]|nr:MAG: hypothetical protein DRJ11_03020 [Candidatus Aminicenantes bacterium]RLE04918.1 MAG: hypothetical protein DRI99_03180 [Candidatus Aminicenantes bacterium]